MEVKKISFGFTKVKQKPNLVPKNDTENNKIELIDCLEGQTIKIKDAVEEIKTPLVIPIRDSTKNLLERVRETKKVRTEAVGGKPDSDLSLDELAAKQLIEEAQAGCEIKKDAGVHELAMIPDAPVAEDKEEPSLADYENIPIEDYGLAMLRGMGWTEGSGIGKNQKITKLIEPELRPKGMGLGAAKIINAEQKPPPIDKDGKELVLIKGAYAKIIAGGHRGNYCEVLGLDDESGRIIVKTTIKNLILSLNEFLVQPVTKEEYTKSSKVINNAKYEEYKEKSKIKLEVLNSSEDSPDLERKQSKQNSKSDKSSSRNKNPRERSNQYRNKSHEIKSEDKLAHKAETSTSKHLSRPHSYDYHSRSRSKDYRSRSSKHRDSSDSSKIDHSDSSVEPMSKRDSESSDYYYSRNKDGERERKREERRKKKSKKQKHEHKKSKSKSKKKYQDTSSDSEQSDQSFRKRRHNNHEDNHKNFRR